MSEEFEKALDSLSRLPLPVPPNFEAAVGYEGELSSYLAVYWEPGGDQLRLYDGLTGHEGDYIPYLLWVHHRSVSPILAPFHPGSSEEPARDWLLLDRGERVFYAGPKGVVRAAIEHSPEIRAITGAAQREEEENPGVWERRMAGMIERWEEHQRHLGENPGELSRQVRERMEASAANARELGEWLDSHGWEG